MASNGECQDEAGATTMACVDADVLMYNTVEVRPSVSNYMYGSLWNARPSHQTVELGEMMHANESKKPSRQLLAEHGKLDAMKKFGTFDGVIVHCMLTIFGIMLFLRLSWMVAHAGILMSTIIIAISFIITFVTALSLSAICTNGEMGGGGTYFLISRSLGAPWGTSIGLIFALANAVSVALYVVGFAETTHHIFANEFNSSFMGSQAADVRVLGTLVCLSLLLLCIVGVAWVVKLDIWQLFLLLFSIFWFLLGTVTRKPNESFGFSGYSRQTFCDNFLPEYRNGECFRTVFSVFFPAMTGMVAGANMSSDLKDPQKSIPRGTTFSIVATSIVYVVIVWVMGSSFVRLDPSKTHGLYDNMFIMADVSHWSPIIYAGILASTFSSALASMLGAPRILKAVCEDGILSKLNFFAKGRASDNEPIRGYVLCFFISLGFVMIGDINLLAPIITNFFLWNRTLINYACFAASQSRSPGWRPSFKYYHPYLSLAGSFGCIVLMFALSWWSALLDMIAAYSLYIYVERCCPSKNWGLASHGAAYLRATDSIKKLQLASPHVKNWRPSYLIIGDTLTDIKSLEFLVDQLREGLGLSFIGTVKVNSFDTLLALPLDSNGSSFIDIFSLQEGKRDNQNFPKHKLEKHDIESDMTVHCHESISAATYVGGVYALLQTAGIPGLRPNTLLIRFPPVHDTKAQLDLVDIVHRALCMQYGVGVLCGTVQVPTTPSTIDVWWLADTGGLTLLLPHLLRQHPHWLGCRLRLFLHGKPDMLLEDETKMVRLIQQFRINVSHVEHIDMFQEPSTDAWQNFEPVLPCHRAKLSHYLRLGECIRMNSNSASMVFVTLPYPRLNKVGADQIVQWLMAASHGVTAPILFLRGNQTHVLTLKC